MRSCSAESANSLESILEMVVNCRPSAAHVIVFYGPSGRTCLRLDVFHAKARRVAAYLRGMGVGEGDRIGIVARNCVEWALIDLAALMIKAVVAGFEAGKHAIAPDLV
jgi:long-chain acyl-CoA synthetase